LLINICNWTNKYAEARRDRIRRESHERKWEALSLEKLKGFIGVLILIPMVQKPRFHDYWSENALTGTPGLRQIFFWDEFYSIKKNIRFHDGENFNNADPFYRFRPLFSEILDNTNELYKPPKLLALDESMVKFDGRSVYKVYMPQKPIKYGFKIYSVVPSDFPIVLNMAIHDGKKRTLVNIVCNLLTPFQGKGHVVHMDKYYMTPKVVKALQQMEIGTVGMCMRNRLHLSNEIYEELDALSKGEFCYYESDEMLLTCFQDSKLVCLLSSQTK